MRHFLFLFLLAAGCSSESSEPLVEYPPDSDVTDGGVDALPEAMPDTSSDAEPDAVTDAAAEGSDTSTEAGPWTPPVREHLLTGPVFIEGVTTDGHLILDFDGDLMALRAGATEPELILQDYSVATDSLLVRGRFAALWKGPDLSPPLTLWSGAGSVETFGTETRMSWFVARPAQNDFGYFTEGSDLLHVDLYATGAQQGNGVRVVADLDTALIEDNCSVQVAYAATEMLVGGCPDGSTHPRLGSYDLAGGGLIRTVLDGTIPGFWLNNARTHVLAQTATQATLSAVAAAGNEVTFPGSILQARFSADDATMVYLTDSGVLHRTPTSSADPAVVGQAYRILGRSADLDYVLVANAVDTNNRSDLVLVDTTKATSTELAAESAMLVGFGDSDDVVVYVSEMEDLMAAGMLNVMALPDGEPATLTDSARRVEYDGQVVAWFEQELGVYTAELKIAALSDPGTVYTLDTHYDGLTANSVFAGHTLYVATKEGLWRYAP